LGTSAIGTELQLMPPTVSSDHRRAPILAQKISDNPGRSGYRQLLRIGGPIDQQSGTLKSIATQCAVFRNREEEAIDRTVTIRE
jgi:hypothetical protein